MTLPRSRSCGVGGRAGRAPAFTLVELLLVLAIVGIVTAVTIPNIARSIRGNRLRTAARTVVMAGRYARSMAVLRQQDMTVVFERGDAGDPASSGRVVVRPVPTGAAGVTNDTPELTGAPSGSAGGVYAGPTAEPSTNAGFARVEDSIERELDRVRVTVVTIEDQLGIPDEGSRPIVYETNGRCVPYSVTLVDESGDSVTVHVDALSSVEMETGRAGPAIAPGG